MLARYVYGGAFFRKCRDSKSGAEKRIPIASSSRLGRQSSRWFVYTLLAFIVTFTRSIYSNILRCMNTLFGIRVSRRRFYTFMKSNKLPWSRLWPTLRGMIPNPKTNGRLLLAPDDFINPKAGKKIFGCSYIFDHAAKASQAKYPWAQNVVLIGLFKRIKGRWACLPPCPQILSAEKSACLKIREHEYSRRAPLLSHKTSTDGRDDYRGSPSFCRYPRDGCLR